MRNALSTPLAPYVDALPVPRRLRAADHRRRLTVQIRAATHRFHRDLPDSTVWGYDGSLPGPTIDPHHRASALKWLKQTLLRSRSTFVERRYPGNRKGARTSDRCI